MPPPGRHCRRLRRQGLGGSRMWEWGGNEWGTSTESSTWETVEGTGSSLGLGQEDWRTDSYGKEEL